jgi:hypothetical protein
MNFVAVGNWLFRGISGFQILRREKIPNPKYYSIKNNDQAY